MSFKDSVLGNYLSDFVSLIFPETCLFCHDILRKNEHQLCTRCLVNLPVTNYHLKLNGNPLYNDLKIIENLTLAAAYLKYHKFGLAQTLLKSLKYKGNYEIGVLLGSWYGHHLKNKIQADIILPVPIHQDKLKKRGYNQSTAIAEGIQASLEIPIDQSSVVRKKKTSTQTKRHKVERWSAMKGVFEVVNPAELSGKEVLIVDDVITTGATIFSLCETINEHGPESIKVVSIATGK